MAQTILNDEAGAALVHLDADISAALRYLQGDAIPKEHVERWAEDLKKILDGKVTHPRTAGTRKPRKTPDAAAA
jgi:hypothetical protein